MACNERVARVWPKDYKLALELLQTANSSSSALVEGGAGGGKGKGRGTSAGNKPSGSVALALVPEQSSPAPALFTRTLRVPKCTLKLKKERYVAADRQPTSSQHTPSAHSYNPPSQSTLSNHYLKPSSPHPLHSFNSPLPSTLFSQIPSHHGVSSQIPHLSQPTLSTHPLRSPYLSTRLY